MGSLPNLRSLSNDPNTTYKYELCEPDEVPRAAKNHVRPRNSGRLPGINYNSQNEIHRYKIHHNQHIQLVPQYLG